MAYELAGSAAVFQGDLKLVKNNPPFGDRQWRLYDIAKDPVESQNLATAEPEAFASMKAVYERYEVDFKLIPVPADYNPVVQVQKNAERATGKKQKVPYDY